MESKQYNRNVALVAVFALAMLVLPGNAWAAAGIPGDIGPMIQKLTDWLTAIAKPLAVLMIAVGGITWAMTRNDEGMKTIGRVIIGLCIAISAVAIGGQLGFNGATF